jgi:MoaA/NifB/PqqE/SkfB family radical SAM enzyme
MTEVVTLEPSINPNNRISFLLDWELTMKCNLDCSYCPTGIYGGHDNSTKHPALADCLKTLDFMYKYVDLYMSKKVNGIKYVVLNVYGGESLYHPNIVEILKNAKSLHKNNYSDRWHLTITTTTNAVIPDKKINVVADLIDEFTCSYHSESTEKQKKQFKNNVLAIKNKGRRVKCVILMHAEESLFNDSLSMIEWCKENDIKYLPRQLDHTPYRTEFNYNNNQVVWFDQLYKEKNNNNNHNVDFKKVDDKFDLAASGRACCGGRELCANKDYKNKEFYVNNKFPDWYCSVNEFFLYVKQVNGEIYTNKDCKMNYQNQIAPIGTLDQVDKLLLFTQEHLNNNTMPVIQCKKPRCLCGLCAPKAEKLTDFNQIMKKYHK